MRRFGNPNGQAWYYSVPPKQEVSTPVGHPPFSQIPGLNPMPPLEENSKKGWIKDSDSKYIQLAKQGGRPDLLCPQTNFTPSEKPVGYPQCPWYYDNVKTNQDSKVDCNSNRDYKFSVPEYMADRIITSDGKKKSCSFK